MTDPEVIERGSDGIKSPPSGSISPPELITPQSSEPMTEDETITIQANEISKLEQHEKLQRLKFLIDKSKIYADILAKSLNTGARSKSPEEEKTKKTEKKKPKTKGKRKKKSTVFNIGKEEEDELNTTVAAAAAVKHKDEESNQLNPIEGFEQPYLISGGTLHPYQLRGVEWLVSLFENGLNGILADEMGLGKTIQTISFLAYLIEQQIQGPYLVVAPLSTLQNWVNEINRFAPSIPVLKYHGRREERADVQRSKIFRDLVKRNPKSLNKTIVVTSYEVILKDSTILQKIQWKYMVIDEGHRLKNMNCKLIKELKKYDTNRLLLTGTPLQNNLAELWSLLNFLLPDVFSDLESFQAWFDTGGDLSLSNYSDSLIRSLHEILRPFLLRRLKSQVSRSLPDKREYVIYGNLTVQQTELYQHLLNGNAQEYIANKLLQARGYKSKKIRIRNDNVTELPKKRRRTAAGSYAELSDAEYFKTANVTEDEPVEEEHNINDDILENVAIVNKNPENEDSDYSDIDLVSEDNDEVIDGMAEEHSTRRIQNDDDDSVTHSESEVHPDEETKKLIRIALRESKAKSFQNQVMQLRQACNSPYMFYFPWNIDQDVDDTVVSSSIKMKILDDLSTRLVQDGHKILIFSQFSRMLDLIQDWAQTLKKWEFCRIDGSTTLADRQQQIDEFNINPDIPIFMLSTRAGGLGINLVGADTVILFDSDWNPQVDLQAIDRVHRIGQTKPVIVYRIATGDTVEEILLERATKKRRLEQLVIEQGKFLGIQSEKEVVDTNMYQEVVEAFNRSLHNREERQSLHNDNHEKVKVEVSPDGPWISEKDFNTILDRSSEGYARARNENEQLPSNIKTIVSVSENVDIGIE